MLSFGHCCSSDLQKLISYKEEAAEKKGEAPTERQWLDCEFAK